MKQSVLYVFVSSLLLHGCDMINANLDKCSNPAQPDVHFECEMTKSNRITYEEYKALEKREADRKPLEK